MTLFFACTCNHVSPCVHVSSLYVCAHAMSILVGLAQDTPEHARGDPGASYHLTPTEKKEYADGLDDGTIEHPDCLREHGGGEYYKPSEEHGDHFKHDRKKVMGHVREGFLDEHDNLYLVSHLDYTHPDTQYINKVIDKHDDKSRLGYSVSTDVARSRRGKGPITEKFVAHLGITEDPLYHDDGHTRIFFRGGGPRDLDNWLREKVLDKPGFYLPKNMQRRLRDPDHLHRHSVGASGGAVATDLDLVTSPMPPPLAVSAPLLLPLNPVPLVAPASVMSAPAPDNMDVVAQQPPPAQQQQTPPPASTPATTPASTPTTAPATGAAAVSQDLERMRANSEYQRVLDEASTFVKLPDLTNMAKKEAVSNYAKAFDLRRKLEDLQDLLNIPRAKLTEEERKVAKALDRVTDDIQPKLIEELQATDLIPDTQKSMRILGAKSNPLLDTDMLLSVHANAITLSNQRSEQLKLTADLAEQKRQSEVAQKKMSDEMAEMRRMNENLASQVNEYNKRPRDTASSYQTPAAQQQESGSVLRKTREEPAAPSGNMPPPASKTVATRINGIDLPQRFSVGASAGVGGASVFQMASLTGNHEMPMPVKVMFRENLGNIPPFMASKLGLNLSDPVRVSPGELEHYRLLQEKAKAFDGLALLHNERTSMLGDPVAFNTRR